MSSNVDVWPVQSSEVSASDEWRKSPGKKDTKKWCRGRVGREHVLEVEKPRPSYQPSDCRVPSGWWTQLYGTVWRCEHQLVCTACRKVLKQSLPWQECPDLPAELVPATDESPTDDSR